MAANSRSQAELSRETGIGEPHISLLLRGLRQGTIGAWDKLLRAAHGSASPIVKLPPEVKVTADGKALIGSTEPTITLPAHPNGTTYHISRRSPSSLNPRRPA